MTSPRHILSLALLSLLLLPFAALAQQAEWRANVLDDWGQLDFDLKTGLIRATNRFEVRYDGAVLSADRGTVNRKTGETVADGHVRIERDNQVWVGEHIEYNFLTRQLNSDAFRTGRAPVFASGRSLSGDASNRVYTAQHAYITTDDVSEPGEMIRAKSITIIPGKSIEARNAVLYLGKVPMFYFPYYKRKLDDHSNHFQFTPGFRNRAGAFLLGSYTWYVTDELETTLHLDYRTKRGVGTGADANVHLDRWGEASISYYYAHDLDANTESPGLTIPEDRQRVHFTYNATPYTNLNVKSRVSYESDERLLHDFFEGDFRRNPQPSTFFEVNKLWPDFSLDVYAQPRVNDYLETVERLPEVKLTAYRQQLATTPLYYESESSAGYYRHLFADTNNPIVPSYAGFRGDTYHQLTLPQTYFGWLNVTPRVGGRFTYYGGSDATNSGGDLSRVVFNTGVEFTLKASRLWPEVKNKLFDVDGIRHIVEPSVNYVYMPEPNQTPKELPQFDYQPFSLRQLPIEFPDYNSIDAIESEHTLRLGVRNRLQTKRAGKVDNLVSWALSEDWHVDPQHGEDDFGDLFSDVNFKPRSWITTESLTRWDVDDGKLNLALHSLTLQPNDRWSVALGHWYTRDGFIENEDGRSLISSKVFYKFSENWCLRAEHYFETRDGRLEEQDYTIYRDLRSWTAAVTLRLRRNLGGPDDVAVAFTFSLKAAPHFSLGSDTVRAAPLLGY